MTQPAGSAFLQFVEAFRGLDVDRVLPYYDLPCFWVTPHFVVPVTDADQLRSFVVAAFEGMKSKGYSHTEPLHLATHLLSDGLAVLTCEVSEIDSANQEFARFKASYTLRQAGDSWLVVATTVGI